MNSDNPSGADNQQERPSTSGWLDRIPVDLGHYIAGFVDGEGSFNVPIRQQQDRVLPLRVALSFNVSQIGEELPKLLRDVFGVGGIRGRSDGVWYFEVTRLVELKEAVFPFSGSGVSLLGKRCFPSREAVFPFFDRFPLRGPKRQDLAVFRQVAQLIQSGRHLTPTGIDEILTLRSDMNRGGKETTFGRGDSSNAGTGNPQRPYAELLVEARG